MTGNVLRFTGAGDRLWNCEETMTDSDFTLPEAAPAVRLGPNPDNGRDLVVGDVHGHFATLRHALAELEVGAGDRLFSLGDLVDRGPDCFQAKAWIEGSALPALGPGQAPARFDLVVRGDHEQLMLDALGPQVSAAYRPLWPADWNLWRLNGGDWWEEGDPVDPASGGVCPGLRSGRTGDARSWAVALAGLPFAARIETSHGPVGLVHACPVHRSWEALEEALRQDGPDGRRTRTRALWSRVHHRTRRPETDGPVAGVRAVLTGHTPMPGPVWRANVLDIDTGIVRQGMRRLTVARIDTKEIGTWTFDRVPGET